MRLRPFAIVVALTLAAATARAQEPALPDLTPPPATPAKAPPPKPPGTRVAATLGDNEPEIALDVDREIDLANVVTSAAKGVTTVQEAPSIITIVTADDIKARGFKWLADALASVPGWIDTRALGSQVTIPSVRGVSQAALLLRDGVSMFDPWANVGWFGRTQPLETVKRIEVVTGPGGVLWGANSFLGIVNIITKDADDINGLELSAGYGDGPGNRQDFKGYALFGKSFLNGKIKLVQHASYETFIGETYRIPQFISSSPAPQPGGDAFFGPLTAADPPRSWHVNLDGKLTLGPVSLYYMLPFGDQHPNIGFANTLVTNSTINIYDRYGVLEYKDRFAKDVFAITVKGYAVQFVRDFSIQLFPPSALFPPFVRDGQPNPGGFHFSFAGQKVYRFGGTVDADLKLPFNIRLLFGGELFYEALADSTARFPAPQDPNALPIYCPVDMQGMRLDQCPRGYIRDDNRLVAAGYLDVQWRPLPKLTLDAGVRLQGGFGSLGYGLKPLGSGAVVWNFLPDYHVKLSYASGFRPPVIQNTSTFPGGVQYGANRQLQNEDSQSFQAELNARVLKNVRKVRELELRADYSYTVLSNLIQLRNSIYGNIGRRAIHSAEGYAKLYLSGDHFIQASYTYLYATTTDIGVVRSMPNHWFTVGGSFNLVKSLLDVNVNLGIYGAYEDPNRYPSASAPYGATVARTSDLTLDRLSPSAILQLGFRLRFFSDRLQVSGQFYNVFNAHYYYPDVFNDLTPTVEVSPNPAPPLFNFFTAVSYRF